MANRRNTSTDGGNVDRKRAAIEHVRKIRQDQKDSTAQSKIREAALEQQVRTAQRDANRERRAREAIQGEIKKLNEDLLISSATVKDTGLAQSSGGGVAKAKSGTRSSRVGANTEEMAVSRETVAALREKVAELIKENFGLKEYRNMCREAQKTDRENASRRQAKISGAKTEEAAEIRAEFVEFLRLLDQADRAVAALGRDGSEAGKDIKIKFLTDAVFMFVRRLDKTLARLDESVERLTRLSRRSAEEAAELGSMREDQGPGELTERNDVPTKSTSTVRGTPSNQPLSLMDMLETQVRNREAEVRSSGPSIRTSASTTRTRLSSIADPNTLPPTRSQVSASSSGSDSRTSTITLTVTSSSPHFARQPPAVDAIASSPNAQTVSERLDIRIDSALAPVRITETVELQHVEVSASPRPSEGSFDPAESRDKPRSSLARPSIVDSSPSAKSEPILSDAFESRMSEEGSVQPRNASTTSKPTNKGSKPSKRTSRLFRPSSRLFPSASGMLQKLGDALSFDGNVKRMYREARKAEE